jgi:hypothetical protein
MDRKHIAGSNFNKLHADNGTLIFVMLAEKKNTSVCVLHIVSDL